ncbi:hypothetical protein BJX64DRAFT_299345 [Aspergillus heterothallicus]
MSLPTGFQLSVEVTNIIGPVAKSVLRLSSLAVLQALNRSGSDGVTELRLASTLGQHRIAEFMRDNFKTIVGTSNCFSFPGLLEAAGQLILEAGAGPTVRQAITNPNPAWLSMVIQVSLLAFAHETQSLAQAMMNIFAQEGSSLEDGLNYVSSSWVEFFERTESQISEAIKDALECPRKGERKPMLDTEGKANALKRVANRSLPFNILKTLLLHLTPIQDLPEHRNLHLRTSKGWSTLVVWCYYTLGLSISVTIGNAIMVLGENPRIFIEDSGLRVITATVLDPLGDHEPLFRLYDGVDDIILEAEDRAIAQGFVRAILLRCGFPEAKIEDQVYWVVAACIDFLSDSSDPTFSSLHVTSMTSQVRDNILDAVSLLFDTQCLDPGKLKQPMAARDTGPAPWSAIILVILSFARVKRLDACTKVPLSCKAFLQINPSRHLLQLAGTDLSGPVPDTLASFDIIAHLLVGSQYTDDSAANPVLISACGWSIYLDSLTSRDVNEIEPGVIHIQMGVPSRNGERKCRVVDGPMTRMGQKEMLGHPVVPLVFCHGISTGMQRTTLIGKLLFGFREKQQVSLNFSFVSRCPCGADVWDITGKDDAQKKPATLPEMVFSLLPDPSVTTSGNTEESIPAWFVYVSDTAAARWLALKCLNQSAESSEGCEWVVRGNNCCIACACHAVRDKSFVLL